MPDPITTLGLAKTTTTLVKEATALARAAKNTDVAEKLIDVYQNIVELTDTNQQLRAEVQELKNEITALKRRPEIESKLRFDENAYYLTKEDKEDGPFCSVCWDIDGKLVRLTQAKYTYLPECAYCASGVRKVGR
jgi:hypothetical protein